MPTGTGPAGVTPSPRRSRVGRVLAPIRRGLAPVGRLLARIPHPSLRSRRGLFVLFVLGAGLGAMTAVAGVVAVHWTETADFCGRCHTMDPEIKAYEMSPHREIGCAECHVEPGVVGWIKSKVNGTRQLIDLLLGHYPEPIPPPTHAELPAATQTCGRCHRTADLVENGGPVRIVLKALYRDDEKNTREIVALVLRPVGLGLGLGSSLRGVHWHIDETVMFASRGERSQDIDWVGVTYRDGTTADFVAGDEVAISTDAGPDITRLKNEGVERRMDCVDCHNRIGHGIPSLDAALDEALTAAELDATLPYIKRQALDRLGVNYASEADADRALDELRLWYRVRYPLVVETRSAQLDASIETLKRIYRLVATPEMRVTAATYPDNLGHRSAPGCFRCHDGNHFKVVDGVLTSQVIPSHCGTCHTFPRVGETVAVSIDLGPVGSLVIGAKPDSHAEALWIFRHKLAVGSEDGLGTACAACHQPTYCQGCHRNTAIQVPHETIEFDHARQIADKGAGSCVFCHQSAYCERCHVPGTLPQPYPIPTPAPSEPPATAVRVRSP